MENNQKATDHLHYNPKFTSLVSSSTQHILYLFSTCQTTEIMSLTKELDVMFHFIDEPHEDFNVVMGERTMRL